MGGVVRVGNAGMVEAVGVRSRWGGVDSLSLLLLLAASATSCSDRSPGMNWVA
jgi:hypothetical protein